MTAIRHQPGIRRVASGVGLLLIIAAANAAVHPRRFAVLELGRAAGIALAVATAVWAWCVLVIVRRQRRAGLSLYWSLVLASLLVAAPAAAVHLALGLCAVAVGHISFDTAFGPLSDNITIGALCYVAVYFFRRRATTTPTPA